MKTRIILVILIFLLAACNLPAPASRAETPTVTPSPEPQPTSSDRTGLVVRGHVTLHGVGLAGVEIHQRFSAYPATLIAITDENGYYESDFIPIPGDEMVSIEPELAGYTFDPPYYYWRHYHGYDENTLDFTAIPMP
jgi:hypothetical protein